MKFTKPINREVDIDGNTFVVTLDDQGIDFRLKGKRKTAHVDWPRVFEIAEGEQGANARQFLGVEGGQSRRQQAGANERSQEAVANERMNQLFNAETDEVGGGTNQQLSRSRTAGEQGSES